MTKKELLKKVNALIENDIAQAYRILKEEKEAAKKKMEEEKELGLTKELE
jgi:hypothetical protein